jgi:hypothetical protein
MMYAEARSEISASILAEDSNLAYKLCLVIAFAVDLRIEEVGKAHSLVYASAEGSSSIDFSHATIASFWLPVHVSEAHITTLLIAFGRNAT